MTARTQDIKTGEVYELLFGSISQGVIGSTQLVAAAAGKKVRLVSYVVVLAAAGTFKFTDGVADLTGAMPCAVNGGVQADGAILTETGAVNRALNIVTTGAGALATGHFAYYLAPA